MNHACSACLFLLCQTSPLDDARVSHGFCRECELAALIRARVASPLEEAEYAALRADHVPLTVLVPTRVRVALERLFAQVQQGAGPAAAPTLEALAGRALARDLHRLEYEPAPLAAYQLPAPAAAAKADKPFYRVVVDAREWRPGDQAAAA